MTKPLPSSRLPTPWRLVAATGLVLSLFEFGVGGSTRAEDPRGACEDELLRTEELLRTGQVGEATRQLRDVPSPCSGSQEAERQLLLGLAHLIAAGPEHRNDELEAAVAVLLGLIESETGELQRARFHAAEALLRLDRPDPAEPLLRRFLADEPAGAQADQARLWLDEPRCARRRCLPRVQLNTTDGASWSRPELLGQVLLLEFWASWCAPCAEALPALSKLHERMAGRPFLALGVNVDRDPERFAAFVRNHEVSWPQVRDAESRIASESFGVHGYPTWIVVDHEGFVRYSATGWSDQIAGALERAVTDALRSVEPPPDQP